MNIKLEDLEVNDYKIYQDKDSFNFGIDAVLLANFMLRNYHNYKNINKEKIINYCDMCAGNIPIPLIVYAKRKEFLTKNLKCVAIEINKEQIALAQKSILYNLENAIDSKEIKNDIKLINENLLNIIKNKNQYNYLYDSFDVITCNPPYIKSGSGIVNANDNKKVARHEILITFDEICKVASLLIKSNKKFYIIHHSERFSELVITLDKNGFKVKNVQFVHQNENKISNLVLIEAVKNSNEGMKVLEPIFIYEKGGSLSEKIKNYYGK